MRVTWSGFVAEYNDGKWRGNSPEWVELAKLMEERVREVNYLPNDGAMVVAVAERMGGTAEDIPEPPPYEPNADGSLTVY